jgi:formate hydrogenlyase subunit 4
LHAWAALETGSAFEGMGAAREVSYAVLTEAALITAVLSLSVQTGSITLNGMLGLSTGAGAVLLAAGLFTVLLAENCRVPFDDPNTHLELTMIHEAMALDHSGPPFAVVLHGASMKLLLFMVLLSEAVLPLSRLAPLASRPPGAARCIGHRRRRIGRVAPRPVRLSAGAAAADDGVPAVPFRAPAGLEGGHPS